ncbi:MAG: DUF3099 domain-containing protein [Aeromicrobium sp.]|nr:DUF3099 domain-containing protein [Aeromicrobium sp.]
MPSRPVALRWGAYPGRVNKRTDEVPLITSAPESSSAMFGAKERRYLLSMGLRTVCFIGACLVDGPFRWVLIVLAVFLPYVSVVLANAGVRATRASGSSFVPMEHRSIAGRPERDEL